MNKATYSDRLFDEKWVILTFLLGHMLSYLITGLGAVASRIIFDGLYVWMLAVYLYHTVITKQYLKGRINLACQAFTVVMVISSFCWKANYHASIIGDFAVLVFYLFICVEGLKKHGTGLLDLIAVLAIVYTFLMSAISFFSIVLNTPFIQIVSDNRVRGYYSNSNIAGISCDISMLFVWYWKQRGKLLERIPYCRWIGIMNVVIQLLMLYKTKSRTSLAAGLILALIFYVHSEKYQKLKKRMNQKFGKWTNWILATILIGAICFLLFSKYGGSRNLYHSLLHGKFSDDPEYSTFLGRLNYFTSYRLFLWKDAFSKFAGSPVIGYGLNSIGHVFTLYKGYNNTHNLLINTLLYSGIIGTAILIFIFSEYFRIWKEQKKGSAYLIVWFLILFLAASMLDKFILYENEIVNAVFWILCGYLERSPAE